MNTDGSTGEYSVLQAHQCKNSQWRAQNLNTLATAALQCSHPPKWQPRRWVQRSRESEVDNGTVAQQNDGEVESADEHATATKCATCNSKIDGGCVPKPTQIGYYSGAWVDVLEAAKNEYRFYIHCI
jgi:phosphoribosylformylglycinamidine (FGAM) synthase-like enzyme